MCLSIPCLTNLTALNLKNHNNITDVSVSLLTNLTPLNIFSIARITDGSLALLTQLKILDLSMEWVEDWLVFLEYLTLRILLN